EPEEIPVGEEAPVRPVSVYGATKAACENLIHAYTKLYGIRAGVLRYANVGGPRLRHGVIYDLLMKLRRDPNKLEVLGDGTQTRSYVYIDDAVEATLLAYEKSRGAFKAYNVASEDWIAVNDVVEVLLEVTGLKPHVVYKPVLHGVGWPGDVKKIALKIDKLKELGYRPKMKSKEAVGATAKALVEELGLR
ncbi:MAG: NAD-dependent epimerase/dehydratase family protein, partial [Thermoproteus sp.]